MYVISHFTIKKMALTTKKRSNPDVPTWEKSSRIRDETYDSNGYHGERDTTLVPLGSNPMMRNDPIAAAINIFTIMFQQSLKVNFAGNVATWKQVAPATKSGSTTVFEIETRKPGLGAMLAIAPTVTYRQRTITYQIEQYRMSLPFDQFVIEYADPQALALLALGQRQILNILDTEMTNSVLAALRAAYMRQFESPAAWLEETLEYAGVLNEKGFTGTEIVSLFKNIMPSAAQRLLLATSETGFMAMNLPPVASINSPGITSEALDPAAVVSILTRSLQTQGSRRQVDNLDIYGIPHYTDAHNANILQTAENIDSTVHLHGVILKNNLPEGTSYILVPSMTGLWFRLTKDEVKGNFIFSKNAFKIRGSDLMAGPLGGKPLFTGNYWPTKSIQNFAAHNGDGNILTMTGWGGAVTLPDQVAIGAAAYVLNVENDGKQHYIHSTHAIENLPYAENRAKLIDFTKFEDDRFENAKMRVSEWSDALSTNAAVASLDYGVGALVPFIAVRTVGSQEVRTWVSGHPLFERLARMPHTSSINKTLSKVIPTHNEFLTTISTISPVADLSVA